MQEAAHRRGMPVLAPDDVNLAEVGRQLADWQPEVFVVCDYGQILSVDTLSIPTLGGVNLHASLLPRYRGAAPINWAIANGDVETGVTVIHMTPRLDAGPCLVQKKEEIRADETAPDLEARLAQVGAVAVLEALTMLAHWDGRSALGTPQDPRQATRAPRLRKEQGLVDWRLGATELRNQVRAFQPWPGTYTHVRTGKGEPLRLILDAVTVVPSGPPAVAPGTILVADGLQLVVACGEAALSLDRVQPAGKRTMAIAEFLRGHRLQPGDMLAST
jgi:methionyl-tRNA formyltransferase